MILRPLFLSSLVATIAFAEPAPEPVANPAATPTAEVAPVPDAAQRRAATIAVLKSPAAWVVPDHFATLVVEGDSIDHEWLKTVASSISRYLKLRIETATMPEADDAGYQALVRRAWGAAGANARAVVVVSRDLPDPILSAVGGRWAVMNPEWIRSDKAADEETTLARMEKQVYRAVGTALGAGTRPEPKALLLLANTPADLDVVPGCHFQAQNYIAIQSLAERIGMEKIKPRPRNELEAMGLLPPRPKAGESPASSNPE